ncbi:MAG: desulfoferrodoxin family protein [bacterium]|nr:desulfoferrodoxin family protein [bacterium]
MKRIVFVLAFLLSLTLFGHGPSEIEMSYNDSFDFIYVKVSHSVPSVTAHYVKSVKLIINGKDRAEIKLSRQSAKEFEEAYFLYKPSDEDTLVEISATCNIFGSRKEKLEMKEGE